MFKIFLIAVLSFCFPAKSAEAQEYPVKPIRLVVGFPPGGNTDTVARTIAQKVGERSGWRFVVENRPGATGTIANGFVAKADPDGYTVGIVTGSSVTAAPHLMKLPYDSLTDLVPVIRAVSYRAVLVRHPSVPAKTVKELIAVAKDRPGLTFGSSGFGSIFHLAGLEFSDRAGIKMLYVPYKGGVPALTDLVAGRIDLMFNSVAVMKPFIDEGRVRAIAVTGVTEDPLLPGVPTVAESFPGYIVGGWIGLFVPKGAPPAIIGLLNGEVAGALQEASVVEKWEQGAYYFSPNSSEKFGRFVQNEYARYGALIKKLKIKQQ